MKLCKSAVLLANSWSKNRKVFTRAFSVKVQECEETENKWKSTVGLEIHAQIATESKLFSGASTEFASAVNSCVSLFDCAIPGTLPVLNRKCVEAGVLTALALSCKVNETSFFERKHYFYADLPAGYQITQQKQPLASNGILNFTVFTPGVHKQSYEKSSKIKQIQLEQDSGKSLHDEGFGKSLIDLNRAGVPLMELVFEPDLQDGEEAAALVKELSLILQLLGTCSCKMEEGALRIDANVSVSKDDSFGVRTELKNISSVRAVANAIKYEIERQISLLESGEEVVNETRAWDVIRKRTIAMREKEERQDYRFMPETNLPPLRVHTDENSDNKYNLVDAVALRKQLPTLPAEIRQELKDKYQISSQLIASLMSDFVLLDLFNKLIEDKKTRMPTLVAKVLGLDVLAFVYKHKLPIEFCMENRQFIGELIDLLQSKTVSIHIVTRILDELKTETKKMPKQIVEENNWFLITDETKLKEICLKVMEQNPKLVRQAKRGKERAFTSLLNQALKASNECAHRSLLKAALQDLLNSDK